MKKLHSKYQNYFLGIAILLSSIAISIRSRDGEIRLILGDYPVLIFLLVVISSFLVVLYLQMNQRKITSLSHQIKEQSDENNEDFNTLLNGLTSRQKEVYDLIMAGKSNKEIMSTLFIEQSTLKTHINQIYKQLNIRNRKELKSKMKTR